MVELLFDRGNCQPNNQFEGHLDNIDYLLEVGQIIKLSVEGSLGLVHHKLEIGIVCFYMLVFL